MIRADNLNTEEAALAQSVQVSLDEVHEAVRQVDIRMAQLRCNLMAYEAIMERKGICPKASLKSIWQSLAKKPTSNFSSEPETSSLS